MDDFYVLLPSNVKHLAGGVNSTGHYFTYLHKPLHFQGVGWRVALVDISYVVSWLNVTGENCEVIGYVKDWKQSAHLPLRAYDNVSQIVDALNWIMHNEFAQKTRFGIVGGKVSVYLHAQEKVILHPMTASMLGFSRHEFHLPRFNYDIDNAALGIRAPSFPNVHLPLQNIYVYTSITQHIHVGDSLSPLLQTIPLKVGVKGSIQHVQFLQPLYLPLGLDDISVIEIKLCNERGEVVQFEFGDVILKLHFKRVV